MSNIYPSKYPLHQELSTQYQSLLSKVESKRIDLQSNHATQIKLAYEIIPSPQNHAPYLCLANGLGGRLYTWLPVIELLHPYFHIITWDYRGLFDSQIDEHDRIDIQQHAEDLKAILDAEGIEQVHLCGWSMGVQVSLEFTYRYPKMTQSLILINGTYGQVFSTAFQPFFRFPIPTRLLHGFVEALKDYESITRLGLSSVYQPLLAFFGIKNLFNKENQDTPLMLLALRQYISDLLGDHLKAYLSLFQHLDAHSVYHLLPNIDVPTLILSGGLDFLTPPYQSRLMAQRIKNAVYQNIMGTHFILLERSTAVKMALIEHFKGLNIQIHS